MIGIQNLDLRFLPSPAINIVRVNVSYEVTFDQIDRLFFANGVTYRERVELFGRDGVTLQLLTVRDFNSLGWTMGNGQQSQTRTRTYNVSRETLDEDTITGPLSDADEIRCRVTITANNPPTTISNSASADAVLAGDALVIVNNGG
jgi:hypothetical protein